VEIEDGAVSPDGKAWEPISMDFLRTTSFAAVSESLQKKSPAGWQVPLLDYCALKQKEYDKLAAALERRWIWSRFTDNRDQRWRTG
jgi:hypothetical protein